MPHLIVEYSANVSAANGGPVDIEALLVALHEAASATGTAALDALRTRGAERTDYVIGDANPANGFIAVTARLGAGRELAERQRFVDALLDALDGFLGSAQATLMLSVECQEIDPQSRRNKNNVRATAVATARPTATDHRESP